VRHDTMGSSNPQKKLETWKFSGKKTSWKNIWKRFPIFSGVAIHMCIYI
jgi:hypothetical protein